jgi:hypothetical protein
MNGYAQHLLDGKWIRLYPIPFRALLYSKYFRVNLDLVRNTQDFRPESYQSEYGVEKILVGSKIETGKNRDWEVTIKYLDTHSLSLLSFQSLANSQAFHGFLAKNAVYSLV